MKFYIKNLILIIGLLVLGFSFPAFVGADHPASVEIIDIPSAEIVDYANFDLGFRLYGAGGVLAKMVFGVFKPINIGMSWDIDHAIGPGSAKVDTRPPAIYFKAKVFAGGMSLPAVALGYDGQGYGEYGVLGTDNEKYSHREKGIFVSCTREYFIPNLFLTFGGNIYDFNSESVFGFVGGTYELEDKLIFMAEYDNIHSAPENRINLGAGLFVAENIVIKAVGRNLFRGPASERVAMINYKGKF